MRNFGFLLLLGAALVGAFLLVDRRSPPPRAGAAQVRAEQELADVPLAGPQGPTSLRAWAGQWTLVVFGYRSCPDVCPLTLGNISRELKTAKAAPPLRVVFISVDPKRDAPADLERYAHYFNPEFTGVTGTEADLRRLAHLFGAYFEYKKDPGSAVGYSIAHTASLFFLNPQGQLTKTLSPPYADGAIAAMANSLEAVGAH